MSQNKGVRGSMDGCFMASTERITVDIDDCCSANPCVTRPGGSEVTSLVDALQSVLIAID